MSFPTLLILLLAVSSAFYFFGRKRALAGVGGHTRKLHSLPGHYGYYVALWAGLPALLVLLLWFAIEGPLGDYLIVSQLPPAMAALPHGELTLKLNDVAMVVAGHVPAARADPAIAHAAAYYQDLRANARIALTVVMLTIALAGGILAQRSLVPESRARNAVEKVYTGVLILCATIAIFTTLGIVLSVLFESIRFFAKVPVMDFLFGLDWSPQTAIREDQAGSSGAFGAVPLFAGTLLIALIAMSVAAPVGLMSAIYLSEYAGPKVRAWAKPLIEVLAGIPTVVYGFFAALVVAPAIREAGVTLGLEVASESALAAGLVMGIMIIPFVSSLSDDVIRAVPQAMRDGSLALGATQSETIRRVIIPAALPGIVGGMLLAVSRAIGETMIVVMAAGLSAKLTANPLEAVTTVTVQIVTLLVGDQEFDSAKTLAAFALGLTLFMVTLVLNVIALHIVRKYREQYD